NESVVRWLIRRPTRRQSLALWRHRHCVFLADVYHTLCDLRESAGVGIYSPARLGVALAAFFLRSVFVRSRTVRVDSGGDPCRRRAFRFPATPTRCRYSDSGGGAEIGR